MKQEPAQGFTLISLLLLRKRSCKGFTLIELMVVVAIIAILSVIGISIYINLQKGVRDGIRRTEINGLAKSIEISKDPTASKYVYTITNYQTDYNNKDSWPRDPKRADLDQQYCALTNNNSSITSPSSWPGGYTCPTGWDVLINFKGSWVISNPSAAALSGGVRYWKVCARLEGSGTPFCQGSSIP